MIKLRSINGSHEVVETPYKFVELCDTTGKLAILIYMDSEGFVKVVKEQDPDFLRYKKIMKLN